MDNAALDLARRAVACRGWRWMPGMLLAHGERVYSHHPEWSPVGETVRAAERLPDLDDAATLGCVLAMVRGALGRDDLGAHWWADGATRWCVEVDGGPASPGRAYYGPTEAAALVSALESAP